jgi:hypothetical protein
MATNNTARFAGALSVKSEVKSKNTPWQGMVHSGWFLKVVDQDGRYMTGMPVKTNNAAVAKELGAAKLAEVEVVGYIKTENWAPQDGPANWVTVFWAEEVASVEIKTEPEL